MIHTCYKLLKHNHRFHILLNSHHMKYRLFTKFKSLTFIKDPQSVTHQAYFHTSSVNKVNPIIALVIRPLSKIMAVIIGRGVRKWWTTLPENKRKIFYSHASRNKWRYAGLSLVIGGSIYLFYENHVVPTQYTNRRRFILFDSTQLEKIAAFNFRMDFENYRDRVLPVNHAQVVRTKRVTQQLLTANKNIPEISSKFWTVFVVNNPEENCKVYPTGDIVMFSGMLDLINNDDQVAVILAHELSHVILEHTAEIQSRGALIDLLVLVPLALIWACLPNDGVSFVAHWFFKRVVDTIFSLPYSRKLEEEADKLGLFLAASACFDVREASAFWGRLDLIEKYRRKEDVEQYGDGRGARSKLVVSSLPSGEVTFLSTHPSHLERQKHLDSLMDFAISARSELQCPQLKKIDPRESVWALQEQYAKASMM